MLNTRSALDIRENLGQEKKVCLICGKFNVVHPGHLRLFRHAKEISDYLVLGILSDGLSQEFLLPVADRLEGVRANVWVDDAFVIESSIGEAISVLKPDVVLKGKEHENRRNPEKEAVEKYGGVLRFAGGDSRLSSSILLRAEQEIRIIRHATDYLQRHNLSQEMLATQIETMSQARVLVIGDLIVDRYIDCQPVGMSAEDPTLVISPLASKTFVGGAGVVAAHAAKLGASAAFVSICGDDEIGETAVTELEKSGVKTSVLIDPDRPTTLKTRYRANSQTLLRVNELRDHQVDQDLSKKLIDRILDHLADSDLVIFSDFSYGFFTESLISETIGAAQKKGLVMAGDSQSSSQIGDVTKFHGLSLLTPTEKEARLVFRDNRMGLIGVSENLQQMTGTQYIPITLGGDGVFLHVSSSKSGGWVDDQIPALNTSPIDVAGAGDAFLVSTALCLTTGADIWTAIYIGSIASACQISRVGNVPVSRDELHQQLSL